MIKEQKKKLLYDNSKLLLIHFSQKLMKRYNAMDLSHYNTTTITKKLLIQKIDYLLK